MARSRACRVVAMERRVEVEHRAMRFEDGDDGFCFMSVESEVEYL